MTVLSTWAARWGIPARALIDLQQRTGMLDPGVDPIGEGKSEAAVSNAVRIAASKRGMRLWRNNRGGYKDAYGNFIRYGLCNDTEKLDKVIKSHDLIGIDPVLITAAHVGQVLGQFISIEVKKEDWHYTGTPREEAQQAWSELIISLGGRARFVNRVEQLDEPVTSKHNTNS